MESEPKRPLPDCQHSETYYNLEHDNYYCSYCHAGMGETYYWQHIHSQKVTATTECPTCKQPYTREEYINMPAGVMACTMCDKCEKANTDADGNFVICLTKTYQRKEGGW